ncbi:uncharacterized protein E0L32_002753 [Thyridium curvatum]|uniref:Superkiller protein 3 n=1 Tax=Thyridium curvatum TaxID=1093900 RepID=A0A507BHI2_9PEZI|nr:uncharacterized protein E0L32_002753 [Thyridium curvatum]TPX18244.1 hypothetical protein E0L32_002753 [Thyridium curvatum]
MSSAKAQLKAINELIKQQKFDEAVQQAESIVQKDPKNYQAHIFLGFALDKKGQADEAEKVYLAATRLRPAELPAWQGLIKGYERQATRKLAEYQSAVVKLAELYRDADQMYKCQDLVDKFVDFVRMKGDRMQYVAALDVILPGSPIYPALEARVPHPSKTYDIMAQIVEAEDKKLINTLIGERRTRIGARLSQVTLDVKREVYTESKLGHIYRQMIDWATDDDVRRNYEEKLIQYCYERLLVFQGKEKSEELKTVIKLANDMVIIKHPFKLAWDITIDWQDHKEVKEWDPTVLADYCTFFPDSDLCRVLTGYLSSDISPFPKQLLEQKGANPSSPNGAEDESEDDEEGGVPSTFIPPTDEERLFIMTEGITGADSLLAYRMMGEYYEFLEEHESNVELMRKAQSHVKDQRLKSGLSFQNTEDAFSVHLGTALVFYQSPRNHQEAKKLFDLVLEHDPASTPAMIGIGLIYEEEEEYDEAIGFLERALKRAPDNLRVMAEAAWVKALNGDHATAKDELERALSLLEEKKGASKDLVAQTHYRLGMCIWNLDTSKAARKDRKGAYAHFMAALRTNLSYAPTYTSLGIFYADYNNDKKRARSCFLKAVELSSSEVESAERLARSFADDGDWDRVELVAQRVVDSGKVRPPPGSKRKGISWPFAALGVAQLNKQDFAKSIVSFQAALRIAPNDYHSWVGLGESYHSSGRHVAATKAIQQAQSLEESGGAERLGDTWFTKFMLANIKRELGDFDASIALYQEVITGRADEEGVAIALMQTMVDNALDCLEKGQYGKAVKLAVDTLEYATTAPGAISTTFNFWKAVADACSVFSSVQGRTADFPLEAVQKLFDGLAPADYDTMKDIDHVGPEVILAKGLFSDDEKIGVELTRCIHATLVAHKRALHGSAHDIHAQAVSHYNLGWAEYRAHLSLPDQLRKKASRYQKAAIRCFKRAIELEAGNSEFWNALGVATSELNPSVAQHAFVRSLFLNERSAHAWTNLGTLALLQNDVQFANEAFSRAQSNDHDYAHAWVGQGFVALLLGDIKEARALFTHAMEISESSSLVSREQFAIAVFDNIMTAPTDLRIMSLLQPLFALTQIQALKPQNLEYGHLLSMFQERIGSSTDPVKVLEQLCTKLEADYEVSESTLSLKRFALAKTDLARAYLASGAYASAVECGEMALELTSDESDSELSTEERNKARLSAHLTVGLARYYEKDVNEAVGYFETALEESNHDPDAVCVLAQVLWATGTEDAREKARTMLFEVIEQRPEHVQSVILLGIIALLDDDSESLEAVVAELLTLRTSEKVTAIEQSQIGDVLQAIAALSKDAEDVGVDVLTQAQTDIMLHPDLPHGWSNLAEISGDSDYPSDMALRVALKGIAPRGQLGADELAAAHSGTRKAADAQRALMIAPWSAAGWESMVDAISGR